jgi:branched-chain amino acid transport system ATP-binding protein
VQPLLELDGVTAGYGRVEILRDLTFSVPAGSVVALLGPNGVGKTTTLRAISGTLPIKRGVVRFDGDRIDSESPYEIARRGVTLVPEGRGVFPSLTVRENLAIAAHAARDADGRDDALEEVLETFPRLRDRLSQRAGTMSGGEQQMLALSRAFLAQPRILLMDEISMGLAPLIVEELFDNIAALREQGLTIVMVEQFLTYALRLADLCYIMKRGQISFIGDPGELSGTSQAAAYFGA